MKRLTNLMLSSIWKSHWQFLGIRTDEHKWTLRFTLWMNFTVLLLRQTILEIPKEEVEISSARKKIYFSLPEEAHILANSRLDIAWGIRWNHHCNVVYKTAPYIWRRPVRPVSPLKQSTVGHDETYTMDDPHAFWCQQPTVMPMADASTCISANRILQAVLYPARDCRRHRISDDLDRTLLRLSYQTERKEN